MQSTHRVSPPKKRQVCLPIYMIGLAICLAFPLQMATATTSLRHANINSSEDVKSVYQRATRWWFLKPCQGYQRMTSARSQLKRQMKELRRRRKFRLYHYTKRTNRKLWKMRKRAYLRCMRIWRKRYGRHRITSECKRAFRPRHGRDTSFLWFASQYKTKIFINGRYCGEGGFRARLNKGTYRLHLVSAQRDTDSHTIRLQRRQTSILIHKWGTPPTATLSPTHITTPQPTRRTTTPKPTPIVTQTTKARPPTTRVKHAPRKKQTSTLSPTKQHRAAIVQRPPAQQTQAPLPKLSQQKAIAQAGSGQQLTARHQPMSLSTLPGVSLNVGIEFFSRNFYYTDDIFQKFHPYHLLLAPAIALDVQFFPGMIFGDRSFPYIGLWGHASYALGLRSRYTDGSISETTAAVVEGGLIGQIPAGSLMIRLLAGYRLRYFAMPVLSNVPSVIPNSAYQQIQVGAGLRWTLNDRAVLTGRISYLLLLHAGDLQSEGLFPRLTGGGIHAEIGLNVALTKWLEWQAGVKLDYHFFAMNPQPGDTNIAGGAVDQYMYYHTSLRVRY